jgi:hypothetical protein
MGLKGGSSTAISAALLAILSFSSTDADAQTSGPSQPPLHRAYIEGQTLHYRMRGVNEAWHYSADAKGIVKKDGNGSFYEDFGWSNLMTDGKPETLVPGMAGYSQHLSLDPTVFPGAPNLSGVDPKMIGPVTDLMTFYVDYWLAAKFNQLLKPGDHFYFANPTVPSWADGQRVIVGEDAIEFDMTLKSVDAAKGIAELEVRHVPPPQARIHLAASWMQAPQPGQVNNWVQVMRTGDGQYLAAVGQEYFDVQLTISLADGRILHGAMRNPVDTMERLCSDTKLTQCDEAKPHHVMRTIEIDLEH